MRIVLSLFFVIIGWISVWSQSSPLFTFKDSINIYFEDDQKLFISHKVKSGNTLFSISKFYALPIDKILETNPMVKTKGLTLGADVKIPLSIKAIRKSKTGDFYRWKHIPLCYEVKESETLFKIATTRFNIVADTVARWNNIGKKPIAPGQVLIVGWLPVTGVPAGLQEKTKAPVIPLEKKVEIAKKQYDEPTKNSQEEPNAEQPVENKASSKPIPVLKEYATQGVAYWMKSSVENRDLYALHRDAPLNSYIAITNPMKKTTTYAKVIDRIPAGTFSDVEVIVSPAVAKMLGSRDPKFFVQIKYKK